MIVTNVLSEVVNVILKTRLKKVSANWLWANDRAQSLR